MGKFDEQNRARRARHLNAEQFPDQPGLFPETHPAMRERGPAEMPPEKFREAPGTYFHGTFHDEMPRGSTSPASAGIHLGTLQAAKERIDTFGERNSPRVNKQGQPDYSADIHARRLRPTVKMAAGPNDPLPQHREGIDKVMYGHPEKPKGDLGNRWDTTDDAGYSWVSGSALPTRNAHQFGEFYRNDAEDRGSVSIRVPDSGYLQSHREAIDLATRNKEPVHPLNQGLIRNHGGAGIDEPIRYQAGDQAHEEKSDDHWRTETIDKHGANTSRDAGQPMLLPYKVRARRYATSDNPNNLRTERLPGKQHTMSRKGFPTEAIDSRAAAVTFAATHEEAQSMTTVPDRPAASGRHPVSASEGKRPLPPRLGPQWGAEYH